MNNKQIAGSGNRLARIFRDLIAPAVRAGADLPVSDRLVHLPDAKLMIVASPDDDNEEVRRFADAHGASIIALGEGDEVLAEHHVALFTASTVHHRLAWCLDEKHRLYLVSEVDDPEPVWVSVRSRGLYWLGALPLEEDDLIEGLLRAAAVVRRASTGVF
jgi:hypothetical protein